MRVVRGPDRVKACVLEDLDPPLGGAVQRDGAEWSVVLVDVSPKDLHLLAVEQEAVLAVPDHGANPERLRDPIRDFVANEHLDTRLVEARRLH